MSDALGAFVILSCPNAHAMPEDIIFLFEMCSQDQDFPCFLLVFADPNHYNPAQPFFPQKTLF
ncbi:MULTISPECIES: hypothetical protein [Xenorhabdus]|uniref:Uncharacterized protein n=1 Tax=Xenorhabdus aichiensis TaxID=3025874 RepID=A0ABT5M254_9GAMM|nr:MULTISPECIES: hypothetical protein [Xenorhabdus]MDC9621773.1 hypothetical protein [Xenorhabdus aichiensis]